MCAVGGPEGSPLLVALCGLPCVFVFVGRPEGSPSLAVLCGLPVVFSSRSHCTRRPQGEAGLITPVTFDVLEHPPFSM